MNKTTAFAASILMAISLSACGASDPAPVQPTNAPAPAADEAQPAAEQGDAEMKHGDGQAAGEQHEHNFPGEVKTFHDTMAPLWHAEPGDARVTSTCDGVPTLKEQAAAISTAAVPAEAQGHEADWQQAATGLSASLDKLAEVCATADRAGFDDAFKGVHDAFHALIAHIGHEEKQAR
jgi:hypothetical protein